jgi:hypothetical protein
MHFLKAGGMVLMAMVLVVLMVVVRAVLLLKVMERMKIPQLHYQP